MQSDIDVVILKKSLAMIDLPTIQRKQLKASYSKPEVVKVLERIADAVANQLHLEMTHLAHQTSGMIVQTDQEHVGGHYYLVHNFTDFRTRTDNF